MMDSDSYKLKREFITSIKQQDGQNLFNILEKAGNGLLSWQLIGKYKQIDPENTKLRLLIETKILQGSWKLLWVPASMPYYVQNESPFSDPTLKYFTKSLVFSAWHVVPKVIATIASYEAER